MSTGVPSRQRANAGLDQNSDSLQIIFREGTPARDPQVLIIAPADRRQALVEIDAIVAIMLGITAEELLTIYRTQFPVLQKYERDALYDANGRQVPGKLASEYRKKGAVKPEDLTADRVMYVEPFVGVDRERDMELAHKHFSDLASATTTDRSSGVAHPDT